jgi:hypothetical protein
MSQPEPETEDDEFVEELDRRAAEALEDGELVSFEEHTARRDDEE